MINLKKRELKDLSLIGIEKHARKLRQAGYSIEGHSELTDTEEYPKTLRDTQGVVQNSCLTNFKNKTDCLKNNTAASVKSISEECGIDIGEYRTKNTRCEQLLKLQKQSQKSPSTKEIKRYTPQKKKLYEDDVKTDEYLNLNRLTVAELKAMAKKKNISISSRIRKRGLIMALLEKEILPDILPTQPSDKKLKDAIIEVIEGGDLHTLTRKMVIHKLQDHFGVDLKARKKFIKSEIENYLNEQSAKEKKKDERKCGEHTHGEFMNMDLKDLKDVLSKVGLKKGLPTSRDGKFEYFCSAEENGRCDPSKGQWCDGEFVCDVSNSPGVCVSPYIVPSESQQIEINEHKVAGTIESIKLLKTSTKKLQKLIKKISKLSGKPQTHYINWSPDDLKIHLERLKFMQRKRNDLLVRAMMIDRITDITKESPSKYTKYSLDDVIDVLGELESKMLIKKDFEQTKRNDLLVRSMMIDRITDITKESPSKYAKYSLDDVIDVLDEIERSMITKDFEQTKKLQEIKDQAISEADFERLKQQAEYDNVFKKVRKLAEKNLLLEEGEGVSAEIRESILKNVFDVNLSPEDILEKLKKGISSVIPEAKIQLDDESYDSYSSDIDEKEYKKPQEGTVVVDIEPTLQLDDLDIYEQKYEKPKEGTVVVDIETTLSNVLEGSHKIGQLSKIQNSILKCMGLMSAK